MVVEWIVIMIILEGQIMEDIVIISIIRKVVILIVIYVINVCYEWYIRQY